MIKIYSASADNTITNAYKPDLTNRGTGSNMGAADILEIFSLYGQASGSSDELSRVLIKFPTTPISTDRTAGNIPASLPSYATGTVPTFILSIMFNCKSTISGGNLSVV